MLAAQSFYFSTHFGKPTMHEHRVRVSGSHSELDALHASLKELHSDEISVSEIGPAQVSPLDREPMGIEPLEYFVVVFAAHLSADFVKEWIKSRLASRKTTTAIQVVEEPSPPSQD